MNSAASSRRYLSVWMPYLVSDRWRHDMTQAGAYASALPAEPRPLVFVEKVQGAMRIVAVDAAARAQRLAPGMSLADARARVPALKALASDRHADAGYLDRLAETALAVTPSVALDHANGLVLDIAGCAHLFGGEADLVARLQALLRTTHGVSVCRMAVAPTPDMARALARFSRISPVFADDDERVRALPVAALECDAEDARALRRAGLKTIGAIAQRPSVLFTARFSKQFTVKLARILGEEDRHITPLRAPPVCRAEHRCAEPVASSAVIEAILQDLAQRIAGELQQRDEGGRAFEVVALRSDGAVRRVAIETSEPTRDPAVLLRLYRDRLIALADPLDPGFGFDLIGLQVLRSEPLSPQQSSLDARAAQDGEMAALVDRLSAMFGRARVTRLEPVDTHIPERTQRARPALDAAAVSVGAKCGAALGAVSGPRPLFLFGAPQPIDADGDDGHGAPARFLWRRLRHDIVKADGPERIADEWWRTPAGFGTRDYFRVETATGQRFWIFRANATAPAPATATANAAVTLGVPPASARAWFVHGVFP